MKNLLLTAAGLLATTLVSAGCGTNNQNLAASEVSQTSAVPPGALEIAYCGGQGDEDSAFIVYLDKNSQKIYILSDGALVTRGQPERYYATWANTGNIRQLRVQTEKTRMKVTLTNQRGSTAWADFSGSDKGARPYPNCQLEPENIKTLHTYRIL